MLFVFLFLLAAFTASPSYGSGLTDLEMVGNFGQLERAAEQKLSTQPPSTSVLGPLCLAYSRTKRYGKLFECLDKLERQIQTGDYVLKTDKAMVSNSDGTPMPNMLRAEALIELGNYQGAVEQAKIALGKVQDRLVAGIWPPKVYRLSITGTLGLAYALGGDRKNAIEQIRQLEEFSLGFVGSAFTRPFRANAVAKLYMAIGDYQRAFEYVKNEDNALLKTVWFMNDAAWGYSPGEGPEIFVTLPKLFIRGKCLSEIGRTDEAKKTLDAILRHVRIADNGELYWLTLYERGRLAERQGNAADAVNFYTRAIGVIEKQRSTINTEANKIGFVGDKQAVYGRLIVLLAEQNRITEAFDYVERSKSRALVDMLASKKDLTVQGPELEKTMQLLGDLDSLEQNTRIQDSSVKPGTNAGTRNLEAVVQDIKSTAQDLSSLIAVSSVPSEQLRDLIAPGETVVEYYYQEPVLYAFVLNREQLRMIKLDGTGLDKAVREFREDIQLAGADSWQGKAQALYSRLWKPLEGMITEKSVIVVGHGSLHYLPFAALLRPDADPLIEYYRLRFLPSASVLRFIRPALSKKEPQILVFGNPDLGEAALDLRFAENEARAVAAIYPGSKLLLRKEASKTNFKRAARQFRRIHFATHGKFQADSPLQSRLYLASDSDSNGMLTVGELYTMNLDADLVTLSACETGLGKVVSGDDLVGLTRGFIYAGSRSIIATLWSIDDKATADLMKEFYENLAGMGKNEALRQAQIAARKQYPHPLYWAAFQLTGRAD